MHPRIVELCAIGVTLCVGATQLINVALADGLKFVICRHETGEPAGEIRDSRGISSAGTTVVTKETITGIIPSPADKCTTIEAARGSVSVVGSAQEVYCRIYGCYEWPANGK